MKAIEFPITSWHILQKKHIKRASTYGTATSELAASHDDTIWICGCTLSAPDIRI